LIIQNPLWVEERPCLRVYVFAKRQRNKTPNKSKGTKDKRAKRQTKRKRKEKGKVRKEQNLKRETRNPFSFKCLDILIF